jgi:lipopolysaccharide export system protein LptA
MRSRVAAATLAILAAGATLAAAAAQPTGPANALQGFSQNRDKPIKIDAAALEVRDKSKTATFSGNVVVVQGDTTLRCKTLDVFYEDDGAAGQTQKLNLSGKQRIRKLEARGGVVVTQKDQTATGETGVFDMAANTLTLNGNVVMSQGQNVLRGQRLSVDLITGVSRVESGKSSSGRVQGVFLPSGGSAGAAPAAPEPKPEARPGRPASSSRPGS